MPCCVRDHDHDGNCDEHEVTETAGDYLEAVHARVQLLRYKIARLEPPADHPQHYLWMSLLDIEYYSLEAERELQNVQR